MDSMMFFYFLLALSTFSVIIHARIEQIHLSLGTDETEMVITWTDPLHESETAMVHYGESYSSMNGKVDGIRQNFHDGKIKFYTFRALLTHLKPGTDYYYQIESDTWKSGRFRFHTLPEGSNWLPRFAIYGDLGYKNGKSLPGLTHTVRRNLLDVIFHVGNIAFDLHGHKGKTGNKFMRFVETIANGLPYMTCPGNHEHHHNFSNYDARFTMIGDRDNPDHGAPIDKRINNHFHSMDIGPAHIIMFSTEFYYYTEYGWEQIERQYRWLEDDLKRAHQNLRERPWIIVMGHRPLYCLDKEDDSCNQKTMEREDLRQGIRMYGKGKRKFGLEELFYKYRVDLQFYGHEHLYARSLPLYQFKTINGTKSKNPYDNADAPIHVITGTAGDTEPKATAINKNNWVAKYFSDYGFTRLVFEGKHRIHIQQVSVEKHGRILDSFYVSKNPISGPNNNETPEHPSRPVDHGSTQKPDHNPHIPGALMFYWTYLSDFFNTLLTPNKWLQWIYNFFDLSKWSLIVYIRPRIPRYSADPRFDQIPSPQPRISYDYYPRPDYYHYYHYYDY